MPTPDDIDPIQDAKAARERATVPDDKTPAHTPGPWRTAIRRGYIAVMAGPQTATKAVADCRTVDTEHAEAVANCTLIAAAPDLLAACEAAAEHLSSLIESGVPGWAQFNQLKAAIRKATGST